MLFPLSVSHNRHHHQQYHNTIVNSLNSQSLDHLSHIVARKPIIITTKVLIAHLSNTTSNYPVDTLVTDMLPDSDPQSSLRSRLGSLGKAEHHPGTLPHLPITGLYLGNKLFIVIIKTEHHPCALPDLPIAGSHSPPRKS